MQLYSNRKICVAVSGGADSVCLLHSFFSHAEQYHITLTAVTCEHGIRGDASVADLHFVEDLCRKWNVPLSVFRADIPALSKQTGTGLEETGRKFRYDCFSQIVESGRADCVATAHHKDDFAETVLFRLIRGTSLAGLNAFPERKGIIRPLLQVTRAQILNYVDQNSLPYVTDESNSDERYTRNYLRKNVMPALECAVKGAGEHLVEFALRVKADDEYLQESAIRSVKTEKNGDVYVPVALPPPLFARACLYAFRANGIASDYTQTHMDEIANLKELQSGKKVSLPKGLEAAREYENIVFYRPQPGFTDEIPFSDGFQGGGRIPLTIYEGAREGGLTVDLDAFPAGCVIRTRREGDRITPFGGGTKTLKKFLTDRKISARLGRQLPLIALGTEILAVCGVEISDRVKITERTKRTGSLFTPLRAPKPENGCN